MPNADELLRALIQLRHLKRELATPDEVTAMFDRLSPEERIGLYLDLLSLRALCLDTVARIEEFYVKETDG